MKTEYQQSIISKIRRFREERGHSQKYIADLIEISYGQMGNIESPKAKNKYTLAQIHQICKDFNIPIEQVFIEDEEFESGKDIINLLITKIIKYGER